MSENKTPETETVSSTSEESVNDFNWTAFWKKRAEETSAKASSLANKVLESLRTVGIPEVVVSYDGGGDSGQVHDISVRDENGSSDERQSTKDTLTNTVFEDYPRTYSSFDKVEGEWITRTRPANLRDLIEELGYLMIDVKHPGWENNDGAYGELTINAKEGTIGLDHNERYTEVETFTYTFGCEDKKLKEVN